MSTCSRFGDELINGSMTWKKASANKLTKCYVKILTYLCILMYPTKVKRFTLLGAQLAFETIASHFDVPHAMIERYSIVL